MWKEINPQSLIIRYIGQQSVGVLVSKNSLLLPRLEPQMGLGCETRHLRGKVGVICAVHHFSAASEVLAEHGVRLRSCQPLSAISLAGGSVPHSASREFASKPALSLRVLSVSFEYMEIENRNCCPLRTYRILPVSWVPDWLLPF